MVAIVVVLLLLLLLLLLLFRLINGMHSLVIVETNPLLRADLYRNSSTTNTAEDAIIRGIHSCYYDFDWVPPSYDHLIRGVNESLLAFFEKILVFFLQSLRAERHSRTQSNTAAQQRDRHRADTDRESAAIA